VSFEFKKKPPCFIHPQFLDTLRMLKNRPRNLTIEKIAEDCDFTASWLQQLAQGNIFDPSINKVLRLRDYLIKTKEAGNVTHV
jgi:transcriptional regulator with XRE-family HTH domain